MAANEQQKEQEEELAHHARRPMNAFLIFCKKHRGSVRSGFPHLENRAITRLLGDWWATLNPDQKFSYTNLAQEYKDAFLNANPDFKWYKLPAPPLRKLNTRPGNKKCEATSSSPNPEEKICKTTIDGIQPGKLADETQIGGLSSLFTTPQKSQDTEQNDETGENANSQVPKPPKKRYVELPPEVNESKKECKANLFGEKDESNNNNQSQMEIGAEKNSKNAYAYDNSMDSSNLRGERTKKGLRYQTFLAEQMRSNSSSQQSKRKRAPATNSSVEQSTERRNSISSNVSEKTESSSSEGNNSRSDLEHLVESAEGNMEASKPEETDTESAENQMDYGSWTGRKRFKAEDFNLEKKIEALPSLSLEEFQQKKKQQRTKKKKILQKLSSGKKLVNDGVTANQINNRKIVRNSLEEEQCHLVGSQKRKARKQSITRNMAASGNATGSNNGSLPGSSESWCESPELDMLTCLATVAANRTKLTKF